MPITEIFIFKYTILFWDCKDWSDVFDQNTSIVQLPLFVIIYTLQKKKWFQEKGSRFLLFSISKHDIKDKDTNVNLQGQKILKDKSKSR